MFENIMMNFHSLTIFDDGMVIMEIKRLNIKFNKQIYVDLVFPMTYYNYIKP